MKKEGNAKENKRGSKRRRLLLASIAVAILIVAAATFAWFTSKDEVTNRLTSDANYGVSLTEVFTPEEDWVPGQKVNKDVSVVNTGAVDAFVRVGLANRLQVTTERYSSTAPTADGYLMDENNVSTGIRGITNSSEMSNNYPYNVPNNSPYIVLTEDEARSIQAGGELLTVATTTDEGGSTVIVMADEYNSKAATVWTPVESSELLVAAKPDEMSGQNISGRLCIFRRYIGLQNSDGGGQEPVETYEYAAYYVMSDYSMDVVDASGNPKSTYYKVDLQIADGTEMGGGSTGAQVTLNLLQCQYASDENLEIEVDINGSTASVYFACTGTDILEDIENTEITPPVYDTSRFKADYSKVESENYILVTYDPNGQAGNDYAEDAIKAQRILIKINLATADGSEGSKLWKDSWSFNENDNKFYYNSILAAGETSAKLVDSVELDKSVESGAYISFVYDLTVALDSVQVLDGDTDVDNDGVYDGIADAVKDEWNVSATGPAISDVTVKKTTTGTEGGSGADAEAGYNVTWTPAASTP